MYKLIKNHICNLEIIRDNLRVYLYRIFYFCKEGQKTWIYNYKLQYPAARYYDTWEFDGTDWFVAWEATDTQREYVTNLTTTIQYKWNLESWVKSFEGIYNGGEWAIVL